MWIAFAIPAFVVVEDTWKREMKMAQTLYHPVTDFWVLSNYGKFLFIQSTCRQQNAVGDSNFADIVKDSG